MADYTVRTPVEGFTGESAGINFVDGVAEVSSEDNLAALGYFQSAGYTVEVKAKRAPRAKASPEGSKGD